MARSSKWPSKWFFWAPVVGVNLYLLALYLLSRIPSRSGGSGWVFPVLRVLWVPGALLWKLVGRPVKDALEPEVLEGPLTAFAITLALWELAAVALGLLGYGAVLLVYAIVPAESAGGSQGNGSVR